MAIPQDTASFASYLNHFSQFHSQLDDFIPHYRKDAKSGFTYTLKVIGSYCVIAGLVIGIISALVVARVIPSTHHTFNLGIAGLVYAGMHFVELGATVHRGERNIVNSISIRGIKDIAAKPGSSSLEKVTDKGLPNDLWRVIFSYVSFPSLFKAARVCKKWNAQVYDEILWRGYLSSTPNIENHTRDLFNKDPQKFILSVLRPVTLKKSLEQHFQKAFVLKKDNSKKLDDLRKIQELMFPEAGKSS